MLAFERCLARTVWHVDESGYRALERIDSTIHGRRVGRRRGAQTNPTPAVGIQLVPTSDDGMDSRTWFEECVRRAEHDCRAGLVEKVVVARSARWRATRGTFDVAATLEALVVGNPGATVFAVTDGRGDVFAGATPELLARVDGAQLTTHALAGTAARTGRPRVDAVAAERLLHSDKDRREHKLVVDDIGRRLAPVCRRLQVGPGPRIRTLAAVQHLETPFRGLLCDGIGLREVVDALHPTPAVCGLPRAAARRWLATHETWDRGLYAGHIGFERADGSGASAVAIRSVLITGAEATTFAGAGVVVGSDPAAEWRETQWKMQTATACLRVRGSDAR